MDEMIIDLTKTFSKDPEIYESKTDLRLRRRDLSLRARSFARNERLDRYFSRRPPNGSLLNIYRETLKAFRNTSGDVPHWMDYSHLIAAFERLEKKGVLTIETTEDTLGVRAYKSKSNMKVRQIRTAQTDELLARFKADVGTLLQSPSLDATTLPTVRGCRMISFTAWQVRFFIGGRVRALGRYEFETAIRLQDALTFHFSAYRQNALYNTSAEHAKQLLETIAPLRGLVASLEDHWLTSGVIKPKGLQEPDWKQQIEARLRALEERLSHDS